jgi:hypothetical protein
MTTLKALRDIVEAKQVGTLYHYTKHDNLRRMLDSKHPFKMASMNGETISTSRNPQLPMHDGDFRYHNVRISLDGDKISEHHKVKPVAGLKDNSGDIFNHKHSDRVKRSSGEAEESIVHHPFDMKPFIKHVHIIKHRDIDVDVEKHILPKLKKLGIPHSYSKSFSFSKVDEEYLPYRNWDEYFEIKLQLVV